MNDILSKLTEYTFALTAALENTHEAQERPLITKHLAVAAEMYALLNKYKDPERIIKLVNSEIHGHGWSWISGKDGEKVASAWAAYINSLGLE